MRGTLLKDGQVAGIIACRTIRISRQVNIVHDMNVRPINPLPVNACNRLTGLYQFGNKLPCIDGGVFSSLAGFENFNLLNVLPCTVRPCVYPRYKSLPCDSRSWLHRIAAFHSLIFVQKGELQPSDLPLAGIYFRHLSAAGNDVCSATRCGGL